ncbi:MAG: DUF5671 domain-containing protein [bacterium]|nr:DUF5671 domain-containing protein [bacterium]
MDKPKVTPKDFFLWIGSMVALYGGIIAFITLLFDYINYAFPNPVTNLYYSGSPSISYETATLIVLTPVLLILMRLIRRDIANDPSRRDIWIRRWALFVTLFLAGVTIVIDLIVLVNTYLQGEDITAGFLLKVLAVFLVVGLAFLHFLADLRGYWQREPAKAKMVNWAVGALVLVTIVAGFFILGTPQELREGKQDNIRVQDLQSIQWQVVNYWQQKEKLPANLLEVADPISNTIIPVDPQTKDQYEFAVTGPLSFRLCATFAREGSSYGNGSVARPMSPVAINGKELPDNWQHGEGRTCFERTIDPQRYPPYSKTRVQ